MMSFEKVLDKHNEHGVVIIPRMFKGRLDPVPGLYCEDCNKWIKWLTIDEASDLLDAGVEGLDMLPNEETIWRRGLRDAGIEI